MDIAETKISVFYLLLVAFVRQFGLSVTASIVVLHDILDPLIFVA